MKKILIAVIASFSLAVLPAYADGGRGHGRGNYRSHSDSSSLWAGVAIIGAIAGLALLADQSSPSQVSPAPGYVEPVYQAPVNYAPPQPAANVWYYCQSSAMYYPYTKVCPEGWQAVSPGSY